LDRRVESLLAVKPEFPRKAEEFAEGKDEFPGNSVEFFVDPEEIPIRGSLVVPNGVVDI